MAQRFETWIGGRYVRSRSANSFVSLISAISMLGIAIAVSVLIIVLSVVNGFERELSGQALMVFGEQLSGVEIRGVDPVQEHAVSGVAELMLEGELPSLEPGEFNVVLGVELASELRVGIGDKITVILAEGIVTPAGVVPRTKRFTVSGIYRVGM